MASQTLDSRQLDLFVHSRAVILANDTINAMLAREAAQAEACLGRLGAEVPDYAALDALTILSHALSEWPPPTTSPAQIANAVGRLEGEVRPVPSLRWAAKQKISCVRSGATLRMPLTHAYDADFPQSFCAGLYLHCGDVWAAARTAESIPDRERNADALLWIATARYRIDGLDTCLAPLMRLALLAPERLSVALAEIDESLLQRDWNAFHLACDWLDPNDATADAWFPAWYLVEHPGVRLGVDDTASLPATQAAQTLTAIARLLEVEKRGYSAALVSSRRRLRDLNPEMFAFYMARRDVHRR